MFRLIDPPFTEETLEKVVPQEQASLTTSIAAGIDAALCNDDFYENLLPPQAILAFAALWGRILRICDEAVNSSNADVVVHATKTRDTALQIVEACRTAHRPSRTLADLLREQINQDLNEPAVATGPSSPEDPRR